MLCNSIVNTKEGNITCHDFGCITFIVQRPKSKFKDYSSLKCIVCGNVHHKCKPIKYFILENVLICFNTAGKFDQRARSNQDVAPEPSEI